VHCAVARSLLEKQEISFCGSVMHISLPSMNTVEIHGLPDDVDEKIFRAFIESKRKSGGGKTVNVQFNKSSKVAVVTFKEARGEFVHLSYLFFVKL